MKARNLMAAAALMTALAATSCRETNPGKDEEADMGMTSDSVFNETDSIDNNKSTVHDGLDEGEEE